MSIHAADALMEIFGFKRVADDEITLDNPPSLDDDGGSLNEGMKMEESAFMKKVAGQLEVVGWRRMDRKWDITTYPSVCATWHKIGAPVDAISSHSEAIAGYAARDARIAELESRYQRDVYGLNNEGDPIGGDPAGGYANDNARLRAELAAIKAQGVVQWPDADEIMQMAFEEGQPADDASGYCFELEEFDLFIERLMSEVARLNAAPVQQVSVPDGWKLEPVEPTAAMLKAAKGSGVIDPRVSGYCYQLMLAASTTPGDSQ